jgi:hypothetical protein
MKQGLLALVVLTTLATVALALDPPPKGALDAIDPDDLLKHINVLAADEFEGRAPGSQGE